MASKGTLLSIQEDDFCEQILQAISLLQSVGLKLGDCSPDISVEAAELCNSGRSLLEHTFDSASEEADFFFINILGCLCAVSFVALIAGLFLGLLTMDPLDLQIIDRVSIDENERVYAAAVLPVIQERHQLLVTLLILNALAYETLPIFLDNLVPSWVAILLSTTLILFFGEILPTGIFTGPRQLYLGYRMVPLVRFFLWIVWPFARPMTLLLDYLVHDGQTPTLDTYNRGELAALVRIQYEERFKQRASKVMDSGCFNSERIKNDNAGQWASLKSQIMEATADVEAPMAPAMERLMPPLHATEVNMVEGSLQLKTRLAMDVFTPLAHVYAISDELVLNRKGISRIYGIAYSRVPVYRSNPDDSNDKSAVFGFILSRQLMLIDWDDCRDVSTLPLQRPTCVSPRTNLVDLLRILRSQGFLMAFVCARPDLGKKALLAEKPLPPEAGFMGIVTLEDIMESILGDRIYDEGDVRDRDRAVATLNRWAVATLQSFVRKRASAKRQTAAVRQSSIMEERQIKTPAPSNQESVPLLGDGSIRQSYTK